MDSSTFSLELVRDSFHDTFAIANTVSNSPGGGAQTITVPLPSVPTGDGYKLEAIDIANINNVYATTGDFSVAAAPSSSISSTSKGTGTQTSSLAATSQSTAGSSTGGSVGSASSTGSSTGTTGTQTGSSSSSTPSSFNNGNGAKHASGSYAALALPALAGVAFLAL